MSDHLYSSLVPAEGVVQSRAETPTTFYLQLLEINSCESVGSASRRLNKRHQSVSTPTLLQSEDNGSNHSGRATHIRSQSVLWIAKKESVS